MHFSTFSSTLPEVLNQQQQKRPHGMIKFFKVVKLRRRPFEMSFHQGIYPILLLWRHPRWESFPTRRLLPACSALRYLYRTGMIQGSQINTTERYHEGRESVGTYTV